MLSRARRRPTLALAAAATLVATGSLAACGGPKLNGEQAKTGNQVAADAVNALRGVSSAHMVFSGPIGNAPATFDLTFKGSDTKGQLSTNGTTFQVIKIGNDAYVKGSKATYTALANAKLADIIGDRWLMLSGDKAANYTSITLSNFTSSLNSNTWAKAVTQTKLDGKKVVVITNTKNGSQVYVANTGTPYPLKGQGKTTAAGSWTFTDYNAPVTITAPADSISLDALNGTTASPSPNSSSTPPSSPSASPTG
jgi:hypothetical protein